MKRCSLIPLIALAAVALVSLAAPSAQAAKTPRCGQQSAKTYFTKGTMRMYLRTVKLKNQQTGETYTGTRMYACSSKFRKGVRLAGCEFGYECFSDRFTWDGRYLFYTFEDVGPTAIYGSDLYIADLKAGTSNSGIWPKHPGLSLPPCNPEQACIPWIATHAAGWGPNYVIGYKRAGTPYGPQPPYISYVLESHCWSRTLDSEEVKVLDIPPTIRDLKSLRVSINRKTGKNTAHWTSGSKKKSAAFC